MKTDRFSDSIRRKLESIRPDFSENDWARMQDSLRHAAPVPPGPAPASQPVAGNAWSARPWLMAAAVSTVVLVSFAAWQRVQIANLRQTVSQLSRQQTTAPARRPDTVYITRYVNVPVQTNSPAPDRIAQRSASVPDPSSVGRESPAVDRTPSLADARSQQRPTITKPAPVSRQGADAADEVAAVAAKGTTAEESKRTAPDSPAVRRSDESGIVPPGINQNKEIVAGREHSSATPVGNDPALSSSQPPGAGTSTEEKAAEAATVQPTATYEMTANRPLTAMTTDWSRALAYRAKQIRSVRTTVVGGLAPTSQPVNPVAFGFRIGGGAEVTRDVRSGNVWSELLIGRHLTIGAGVGLASFAGGTFLTDEKFDLGKQHKPGKFRREYARGLDPHSDILNIGIRTERVQIPLSIGYRIPLSRVLSLLPSVGTTLNLQSRELVTFTFRQPFRTFETASYQLSRPVDLLNSLSFGAGLEWNRTHWVAQAGPVLIVPTVADANWQERASIGLRARVFYQF